MTRTKHNTAIFYSGSMHLFWTTGVYYLDVLSQHFETTAILENATDQDMRVVRNTLGKKVADIIAFQGKTKLAKHLQYKRISEDVANRVKPRVTVVDHDMYPFQLYLLRRCRKVGSLNVCYQSGLAEGLVRDQYKRTLAVFRSYIERQYRIPHGVSGYLAHVYSVAREIWYHYVGPLLVGEPSFPGASSAFVQRGRNGMRDSDFSIVFSEREKRISIMDGVPESKIVTIPHPLTWQESVEISETLFNMQRSAIDLPRERPLVTVFLDHSTDVYRVKKDTRQRIEERDIYRMWHYVLTRLSSLFSDGIVLVKKHPAQAKDDPFLLFVEELVKSRPNMILMKENVPAMAIVAESSVIVSENSTVLYTSALHFRDKLVISLDLDKKLFGDVYADFPGITYISRADDFETILDLFRSRKQQVRCHEKVLGGKMFSDFLFSRISDARMSSGHQ